MAAIDGIAFIHGGGHGGWVWSDIRQQMVLPSIAIDLPGWGEGEDVVANITLADWVNHAADEISRQRWKRFMLVGHSLAGITIPGVAEKLVDQVAHIVYISCHVPAEGKSAYDSMPQDTRDLVLQNNIFRINVLPLGVTGAMLRIHEDKNKPSPGQPFFSPVSRRAIAHIPSTYVRLLEDEIISNDRQLEMIEDMQVTYQIPVHGHHMAHISKPDMICGVLSTIAALAPD